MIVGGGLLGLSTAYALRERRDVLLLEKEMVGNARGGSHGPTRIFRLGYAEPRFVAMAQRSAELWRALEADTGVQLLHPTPQLTFGPGAEAVFRTLVAAGVPVERIGGDVIGQRFPMFAGRGDAVLESSSAVIAADRTLTTLRANAGAEVREQARVVRVAARRVETASEIIEARAVVVCAGPWSRALVPDIPTTTTLEHAGYVRVGAGLPIFVDFTEPAVYGLPTPGFGSLQDRGASRRCRDRSGTRLRTGPGRGCGAGAHGRGVVARGRPRRSRRVPVRQHRGRRFHRATRRRDRRRRGDVGARLQVRTVARRTTRGLVLDGS